jgi:hypothetical protein
MHIILLSDALQFPTAPFGIYTVDSSAVSTMDQDPTLEHAFTL